ncbi:MAG: ubiquinone biosynthesis regulatory protein kinase UbiB [Gammaproteobacteria bacterium]|nr:ubiquinone biosynthesis regulatory protein kinase UbiB [Gammaproteobacteria bacterium]MBI5617875.1 ubiquinone biosynthesis regulatory protein kinase UbiB [Gammaproteobacteria bacterium]
MSVAVSRVFRVLAIQRTLIRHGFDEMLFATPVLRSLAFLRWLMPWNWVRRTYGRRADRLRAVLEELGPIYVKFGQVLSTRRDLLPDDIAEEFSKLQDHVPPFPGEQARRIVERAFGVPITEIFSAFDETPLASASIAQVHAAKLKDGQDVIVKVVRPGIRKTIEHDFGLIRMLAGLAERYWSHGRRLKPLRVVAEFEKTILDELDMMREAANASQLRRNFAGSPYMRVPEIHWTYTRQNVLVMERISGINIDNIEELRAAGFDLHELATHGVDIFFTQVFRDHFFHADVHPGNLFVMADPETGRPVFAPVDFGIMGSLSEFDQRYLAENFAAFLDRNYRRVAELHVESGWVPADTRVDDFEFAIRAVCEPIFDRPVKDISVGSLLLRLFQTAQRFQMEILPQLLLLQKTLVNVEGIGRQLDPELDLWRTARPSLERFMKDRMGLGSLLRAARQGYPRWADRLPELPTLALDVLDQLKAGRLEIANRDPNLTEIRNEIRRAYRRLVYAVLGVGFVITAAVLQVVDAESSRRIAGLPWSLWVFGSLGVAAITAALRRRPD